MNVSNRAQQLTPSVTLAAAAKAKALKAKRCRCFKLNGWGTRFCNPEKYSKQQLLQLRMEEQVITHLLAAFLN